MKRQGLAQHGWIILGCVALCAATRDALMLVPDTWITEPYPSEAIASAAVWLGVICLALVCARYLEPRTIERRRSA